MPPILKSKLPNTGPTIFSVMSALAQKHRAINLSQGFPDFPADPELVKLVTRHMQNGHNQYAPMGGVESLRQVLSDMIFENHGHRYDVTEEITITHGATQAIAAAISCSIREGDEVVIFTPAYDCYGPMVELNGGTPIFIPLQHPEYQIDWETVKNRINHRTRMIIINTPHNPSGKVFAENDLIKLKELTTGSNILILSDEVYEQIVFEPHRHHSVADHAELRERSFKIGSLGKTLHVTGWKIGYCMAPAKLMSEFRKIHQYMIFSANTPMQYAMADFLGDPAHRQISKMYQQKRDFFLQTVADSALKPLSSHGTYFQLLDYSAVSNKSEVEFAKELCTKHGVAAIPISVFYHQPQEHKVLRFCFAKDEKTLSEAGAVLSALKPL